MSGCRSQGAPARVAARVGVCAVLAVSGLAAPWVSAAASEPATSQPGRDVAAERAPAAPVVGWWDGTAVLAASVPAVADQGVCAALEGWALALLGSGSVAKACDGEAGSLSGSPTGAAWAEGADEGGRFAEVMLVGSAALGVDGYRALGELDVVFDGGAFAVDFAACEHSAAAGWSGCRVTVRDVSLPPGGFVGVGTVGIDKPASASRPQRDTPATPAAQRAALVALYDATDGPNWTRNTNWDTTAPVADWYGVTTDPDGNITRLYLRSNGLSDSVPAEIGNLTNLAELWLFDNLLTSVPAEIGSLTNLTGLWLFDNLLTSVPAEIGSLTNLTELWLSDNQLTSVPAEIGSLTNLTRLWLDGNLLTSVPAEIGSLTNLTRLWLDGNLLTSVPAEIGNLTNLTWLGLDGNLLTSVPAEIGSLTSLTWLRLFDNLLTSVPAEIGSLTNLTRLDLDGNLLTSVPAEIVSLTNLTGLGLDGNLLTSVPAEIVSLTNLTWLGLDGNLLTSVPAEIGSLTNLTGLRLDGNQLTSVPAEIGSLTNLTELGLYGNLLTSVPAEIGNLTNLTWLWLDDNQLTSVPAEIGNLTNLRLLFLDGNQLSGCVPAALAAVPNVRLDAGVSFCETARVSVSDAAVSEGDGAAVFVVSVEPGTEPAGTPISLRWATVSGSAAPGSDYAGSSGTVSIPADRSRATITVPITDDNTAEDDESFSIRLSQPSGATLVDTSAAATIVDDDGSVLGLSPIAPCDGVVLSGSVSGVFDIAQSGNAADSHAFVDVEVTCGTPSEAVGMPIGVEVASGPASSLGPSSHCITGAGAHTVTRSTGAGQGCLAHAVTRPITGDTAGRSTHIVRVPDASIGQVHQLLVWVDADRDGTFDRGEPYLDFESDFRTQLPGEDGAESVLGLPQRFEVSLATPWSDRISRAGQYTSLRLAVRTRTSEVIGHTFGSPVYRRVAIANTPVGVSMLAGPSHTAQVMCSVPPTDVVPSPGYSNRCATDARGYVDVRFRVPPDAVSVLRQQTDVLRVWLDTDHDGNYDFETVDEHQRIVTPEPASTLRVPLAKAVNYVALGDSYSAGENGRDEAPGFVGSYKSRSGTDDEACRRWSEAYPEVLDGLLDSGDMTLRVEFATFACVSAITLNVYDALDPHGTNADPRSLATSGPNPHATDEPRQSVSLMSDADLVTITIGGNDVSFSEILKDCVAPRDFGTGQTGNQDETCSERDIEDCKIAINQHNATECDTPLSYDEVLDAVEGRVATALARVRATAPRASVMLLGYPHLAPVLGGCTGEGLTRGDVSLLYRQYQVDGEFDSLNLTGACSDALSRYFEQFVDCEGLNARPLAHARPGVSGVFTDVFGALGRGTLTLDPREALFLRRGADDLNEALRNAASRAGVHFVDVAGGVPSSRHPSGFVGHDQCSGAPWLHGYVVDDGEDSGANGKSFHPTVAGHVGYAEIAWDYVRNAIRDPRVGLNGAGLPVNPDPRDRSGATGSAGPNARQRSVEGSASSAPARRGDGAGSSGDAGDSSDGDGGGFSWGVLFVERAAAVSGCGAAFVSPAETVTLSAGGFAANSTVSFVGRAVSAGDATLAEPSLSDATTDADGRVEVSWTVPAVPSPTVDAAPSGYVFQAAGEDADGETRYAFMPNPLVAYPGTAPCAVADTAATTLGTSVQVRVLDNDTVPAGGLLDRSSVRVRPAVGGTFSADSASGVVTFTPDAEFWGTVETSYVVYDGWGVGVSAGLTVRVEAGCTVTGTVGVELIEGTDGDDVICVPDRDDWQAFHVIDAKSGDDIILGGAGVEWIYGGDGSDTIHSGGGDDRILAGDGIDTVHGGPGMDSVFSVDTVDTIIDDDYELAVSPSVTVPQAGPVPYDDWGWVDVSQTIEVDVLANDHDPNEDLDVGSLRVTVAPESGTAAVVEDADGDMVIEYTAPDAGGTVSFAYEVCDSLGACATARVTVMVGTADCTITGTEGADSIRGTPGDDVICGLGGDDTIRGIGGADVIVGGPGDDDINAGDGGDTVWGGAGSDILDGGPGDDIVWGAAGDDTLVANAGTDRLDGGPGDDIITGGGGDDLIWGGPGGDTLDGHAGNDTVWGGPGVDMLRGGNGGDTLWGGAGNDSLNGGAGADSLHGGTGDDRLDGSTQNDTLWGGPGDDTLDGRGHDDELHGGPGDDILRGGAGDDRLWGGIDADTLDGGNGTDHLDGGPDTDTCRRADTTTGCESAGSER